MARISPPLKASTGTIFPNGKAVPLLLLQFVLETFQRKRHFFPRTSLSRDYRDYRVLMNDLFDFGHVVCGIRTLTPTFCPIRLSCNTPLTHEKNKCVFRASWAKPRFFDNQGKGIEFPIGVFFSKAENASIKKGVTACVKPRCHIQFPHMVTAVHYILIIFTLVRTNHCNYS